MSLLELSQNAVQYARNCVPLKSNNKVYGQTSPIPLGKLADNTPEKKEQRRAVVNDLKQFMPLPGCNMTDMLNYGHRVTKAGAGNCMEQCACALIYLTWQLKSEPATVDLVMLVQASDKDFRPDHIFLVLGQPRSGPLYPRDFAAWSATAVICDPWAKIACLAREYPAKWDAKMQKWLDRGMTVSGVAKHTPQTNTVVISDKKVYMA